MKPRWATIGFEQYTIQCIIGTHDHEREQPQDIRVNLSVEVDIATAAANDDLENTLNYVQLADICREIALEGQYFLLEAYAVAVLDKISNDYKIKNASIRVCKPKAIEAAEYAFVELTKEC